MAIRATIFLALLLGAHASPTTPSKRDLLTTNQDEPIGKAGAPKGYKVQWVGHSFHVYLPGPVASLAQEAGIRGHTSLGNEFLPASYPCQHWNQNPTGVKAKLQAGKADVLTLSTRELAPDECIGKFAELAVSGFRKRVLVRGELIGCSLKEIRM